MLRRRIGPATWLFAVTACTVVAALAPELTARQTAGEDAYPCTADAEKRAEPSWCEWESP
jgi:hypothetical protein